MTTRVEERSHWGSHSGSYWSSQMSQTNESNDLWGVRMAHYT